MEPTTTSNDDNEAMEPTTASNDDNVSPLPKKKRENNSVVSHLQMMRKSRSTPVFDLGSPQSTNQAQVSVEIKENRLGSSSMPLALVTASEIKPKPPAIVSWKGLVVALRSINKTLIKNISGQITTGYWAIMGYVLSRLSALTIGT